MEKTGPLIRFYHEPGREKNHEDPVNIAEVLRNYVVFCCKSRAGLVYYKQYGAC